MVKSFEEILEAVKSNNNKLFRIKDVPMNLEQIKQLAEAIRDNTELEKIQWDITEDQESEEIEQLKNDIEKKLKYNSQYYYYPDDYLLSLLSLHAYEVYYKKLNERDSVTFSFELDLYHEYNDWKILEVIKPEDSNDNSYLGVIYTNGYHLVLSHRGTVYNKITHEDLFRLKSTAQVDIQSILWNEIDVPYADIATERAFELAQQNGYKLSFTGHSLGGWEAHRSACYIYLKNNIVVHTVAYDAPGTAKILDSMNKNIKYNIQTDKIDTRICGPHTLDITSYLADPTNIVNSLHTHVGRIFIVPIDIDKKAKERVKILGIALWSYLKRLPNKMLQFFESLFYEIEEIFSHFYSVADGGHYIALMSKAFDQTTLKPKYYLPTDHLPDITVDDSKLIKIKDILKMIETVFISPFIAYGIILSTNMLSIMLRPIAAIPIIYGINIILDKINKAIQFNVGDITFFRAIEVIASFFNGAISLKKDDSLIYKKLPYKPKEYQLRNNDNIDSLIDVISVFNKKNYAFSDECNEWISDLQSAFIAHSLIEGNLVIINIKTKDITVEHLRMSTRKLREKFPEVDLMITRQKVMDETDMKVDYKLLRETKTNSDLWEQDEEFHSLLVEGIKYYHAKLFSRCEAVLEKAIVEYRHDYPGKYNIDLADALETISKCYAAQNNLVDSIEYQRQTVDIFESALKSEQDNYKAKIFSEVVANSQNLLALDYGILQNDPEALKYALKSLVTLRSAGNSQSIIAASAHHNVGYIYFRLGNNEEDRNKSLEYYNNATTHLSNAIDIRRQEYDNPNSFVLYKSPNFDKYPGMDLADEYYNRGHVFFKLGDLKNGLKDFCTGLNLYKIVPNVGENNDRMKSFCINIEMIHSKLDQRHDENSCENICFVLNEEASILGMNTNTEALI